MQNVKEPCQQIVISVFLAADGQDGNGLQLEKFRLNFLSCNPISIL